MKNKMKKLVALVLMGVLVVSVCGCGTSKNTEVNIGSGEMPETLTIFAPLGDYTIKAGAKDNNEMLPFQMMEELTGCHVEWTHPAADAYDEKFNIMIASGKFPDAIVYSWQSITGGAKMYADDGVIIPLGNLIDEYMPNFSAYLADHPEVKKQIADNDGEIYYIPFIRKDKELKVFEGPQMRQDWLDKLGLEAPKTPDELYNVLKAFKTQDPNGNGKADEIPMSGVGFDNQEYGIGNLLNAFGSHFDFYLENDKVKYGILEDSYKEGLEFIAKLYAEDLIDIDYLLNDRDKMDNKVLNDRVGFIYSLQPGKFYTSMKDSTRKMAGVPHFAVNDSINNVFNKYYAMDVKDTCLAISTANKNPSGTLRWIDNFFGGEGADIMNFGKEGLTYNMVDGYPKLSDYILNNPDGKTLQETAGMNLGTYQSNFPALQDWRYYEQILTEWGKESIKTWSDSARIDGILPQLVFTEEETDQITRVMSEVETYVSEAVNKIVIGKLSVKDLDDVRKTIKGMGIEKVVKIYNDAYARYKTR